MNSFEAKYMQIASKYLNEKLEQLHVEQKKSTNKKSLQESTIQKLVSSIFK